ncbi:MAG TPA: tryptophanase [Candidatus Polarisedimenticolia bacterium]|jgi:tryptophanase|nr:tryptophanase [Candidatus Polarisedimenticolia bacterium]
MPVIIEPFRIKVVEPITLSDRRQREKDLRAAHYNLFALRAEQVTFDLLTDSGATAMSAAQWGAMMTADESYAGSRSFHRFEAAVRDLTGYRHIIPTHQGRAAERIFFQIAIRPGMVIPSNNHFDTTRANIEYDRGRAVDLVTEAALDPSSPDPFKGNIDLARLEALCRRERRRIPFGMQTITNNTGGGQPASLQNIRGVSRILRRHGIPFILDACRFAENAYFIKLREPGQQRRTVSEIAREIFRLADGCIISGKKDALVNMGGILALNDDRLAAEARNLLILTEGFPTYGGCAARDLEAMAVGLREVLDETYLEYRLASVRYLAEGLNRIGIPTVQPPGGHAVFIDARRLLPQIPSEQFPGQALACELYLAGGIRSCEIGSVMFGKRTSRGTFRPAALELVRLAVPRRVYTQSHVDRILEIAEDVVARAPRLRGMKMTWCPPYLPHFTARFEPVASRAGGARRSRRRSGARAIA